VSADAVEGAVTSVPTLRDLFRELRAWLGENARAAVITAVIGAIVGYLGNVWLMAIVYDGAAKVPPDGVATGEGTVLMGSLFWGLAMTVLFSFVGYRRAVGGDRFWQDLRRLPSALASLVRRDGAAGRIHLLWGAAASLVATDRISPAVGAVLAVGLVASASGFIGRVLSSFAMRIWAQLVRRVAPTRRHDIEGLVAMNVGILGAAGAMLVGALLPSDMGGFPIRLLIAAGCAGAAVMLARRQQPGATLPLLLLVTGGTVLMGELMHPLLAHANDGGVAECGVTWAQWLTQCEGRSTILVDATPGGLAAGVGAVLGMGLGVLGSAGGWDGGDGVGVDLLGRPSVPGDGGRRRGPTQAPPPVARFPQVSRRGDQVVVACANGVTLTASLRADGSLGPWSETTPGSEPGGDVTSRVANDDGSLTTHCVDGSVLVRDAHGGYTVSSPDGTETVVGVDGTTRTVHPDGSIDVRSPDGTIDSTLVGGIHVRIDPGGTTLVEWADGSSTTYHPDGTVDTTLMGVGIHVHADPHGMTITEQPDRSATHPPRDSAASTGTHESRAHETGGEGHHHPELPEQADELYEDLHQPSTPAPHPVAPPAGSSRDWRPTHRVPEGGLHAWERPDPARPWMATLAAGLDVRVADRAGEAWSRIELENGWTAWVDGRRLQRIAR
jgi:hypothetical protein